MQDNRKISEINKTRHKSKKDPEIMPLADPPQADKFRMTNLLFVIMQLKFI